MKKLTPMLGLGWRWRMVAPALSRAGRRWADKIDASNVAQIKDLVSPGIEWLGARHADHRRRDQVDPAAEEVTRRRPWRSVPGQVSCRPTWTPPRSWVAGLPFLKIDPADPMAAQKIAWNLDRKPLITDDLDSRNFDADVGTIGERPRDGSSVTLLDHLCRLMYRRPPCGRSEADDAQHRRRAVPSITAPDPRAVRPEGRRRHQLPLLRRSRDSRTTELYLPSLRRVRPFVVRAALDRLSGQGLRPDSIYHGYDGTTRVDGSGS